MLREITRIISKAKDNVSRLVKEGQSGELKSQPGMSLYASGVAYQPGTEWCAIKQETSLPNRWVG